jgi:hypothetical protein
MEGAVMSTDQVLSQFSRNRLGGEPVPHDLQIFLPLRDELAQRTGIRLEWAEDWAPWLAPVDLTEAERRDPDVAATLRATEDVCRLIAFVASIEDGSFLGYWRGPGHRPAAESPLVLFDAKGQFHLLVASSFAEAILAREYGRERFAKLRAWLRALGIPIGWETPSILTAPHEKPTPKELYKQFFDRYRRETLRQD